MTDPKKPVVSGPDFVRDGDWKPRQATQKGALRLANQLMPADLKRAGFESFIFDAGDYWRINYGKKVAT